MEQSPYWEASSSSTNQEVSHILWNSEVYYCIYKSLPPVSVMSQISPLHASHKIILPCMCRYAK